MAAESRQAIASPVRSAGFQPARSAEAPRRPLRADFGRTPYFVSTRVHGHRPVFVGDTGWIATQELKRLRKQYGFLLLSFVFMPDHAHFVIVPAGTHTISSTMRLVKGRVAPTTNRLLNREGKLWQEGFWDEAPRSIERLNAYIDYVHANPTKAGLSAAAESYPFSSAGDADCLADYHAFFDSEREEPAT